MNAITHSVAEAGETLRQATAQAAAQARSQPAERAPTPSLDALGRSVAQVRAQAGPAMHELAQSAEHVARDSAVAVRERAVRLGDAGAGYVREHPMQSVLIAAGAGAALALLLRALARAR
jgi:ElaB/YqjD/DUF883 family membrane-anchored ribosome-binding protein